MINKRVLVGKFPKGTQLNQFIPGDLVLTHGNAFVNKLIRFGQQHRFRGDDKQFAYWNHVAVIVSEDGGIVEALSRGISLNNMSKYKDEDYFIIHPPYASLEMMDNAVKFARHCYEAHEKYGFFTIANIILWTYLGGNFIFGINGQEICSCLGARASERWGEIYDRDPVRVMPAHIAKHFDVIRAK